MSMRLGFALVTHCHPGQVLRLSEALRALFPDCEIACHHDFSRDPTLQPGSFPGVRFVEDFVRTAWGHSSVIDAAIKAFRVLLATEEPPDWFYLLSGADYPIQSASRMRKDLAASGANVFIHHVPADAISGNAQWNHMTCRRYYAGTLPHFPPAWRCFAGEHWFTADLKAIRHLLDVYDNDTALLAHYRSVEALNGPIIPEESFYHTVFCNAPDLRVVNDCLRYIDWSGGGLHPKTLTLDDLDAIENARGHFARKLSLEETPELLEALLQMCCEGDMHVQAGEGQQSERRASGRATGARATTDTRHDVHRVGSTSGLAASLERR